MKKMPILSALSERPWFHLNYCWLIITASLIIRLISIGYNDLLVEEAYYWNYSIHLDMGYLDHPPMVALLIYLFTSVFGLSEFSIRLASLFCWAGAGFFIYRWTQLIMPGAGRYAVMLLSILPFFFLQSLVITPDQPLIVCWSAVLYYLYRALILEQPRAWYAVGLWFGLGMLSKYTIILLAPPILLFMLFESIPAFPWSGFFGVSHRFATPLTRTLSPRGRGDQKGQIDDHRLFFLSMVRKASLFCALLLRKKKPVQGAPERSFFEHPSRRWLKRKEPYIGALIALLLFSPVIYWNYSHEWASFVFQGKDRFTSPTRSTFHQFLGLVFLFLMPPGLKGLWLLLKKTLPVAAHLPIATKRFIQLFTLTPLIFFGYFSLTHVLKFNWIGPGLLALIPWLAFLLSASRPLSADPMEKAIRERWGGYRAWKITSLLLLSGYALFLFCLITGSPKVLSHLLFNKYINWQDLTYQVNQVASQIENKMGVKPLLIPLDTYNIGSELSYYQAKLMQKGKINKAYPIVGRQVFGLNSLMYRYWGEGVDLSGKTVVLITTDPSFYSYPAIKANGIKLSPVEQLEAKRAGDARGLKPYYYQVMRLT